MGAGLTAFAYFGRWADALKALAEYAPGEDQMDGLSSNIKSWEAINARIGRGEIFEAAQDIEDSVGPENMARNMATVFSPDKLENNRKDLPQQAIFLLPKLFPGSFVLTTNFDEVLEAVYGEVKRSFPVLLPDRGRLINHYRQEGATGLLKLHGTMSGRWIDYENVVFTQKQYDAHYGPDSPLPSVLKDWFNGKIMFFWGAAWRKTEPWNC